MGSIIKDFMILDWSGTKNYYLIGTTYVNFKAMGYIPVYCPYYIGISYFGINF